MKKSMNLYLIGMLLCTVLSGLADAKMPEWAETNTHPEYPSNRYLLGVGISESSLDEAKDHARVDVVKQIRVQITSEMLDVQESLQIGKQEYYRNQIRSRTETLVQETVSGMQVVETTQAKGVFYALAVLDRRRFAAGLEQEMEDGVQAIHQGMSDADRLVREGRIAPAVVNLTQAHDRSTEVLSKRVLIRAISPVPPMFENAVDPAKVLSRIREILTHLRLEKVSGDGQIAEPQAALAEPLVARLVIVQPDQETTPVEGMPVRFESAKGKKIQEVITDQHGSAATDAMAYEDRPVGRIIAHPVLSGIPPEVSRDLPITEVVFYYAVEREGYPVQIAVAMENGSAASKVETNLTKVLNKLGYVVDAESPILLKGEVVPGDTKEVEGLGGTRILVKAELDLSVTDLGSGTVLESLTFSGKGMDKTEKAALRKAVKQIKIKKKLLAPALRNAKHIFSVVREREAKANFEKGQHLFQAGQTQNALLKLSEVPVGTPLFLQAQELIRTIQRKMPIMPGQKEDVVSKSIGEPTVTPDISKPAPSRSPMNKMTLEKEGFTFELVKCERSDRTIPCSLIITNNGEDDRELVIGFAKTKIFDQSGNEYTVCKVKLANSSSKPNPSCQWSGSSRLEKTLIPGVPTPATLVFKVSSETTQISLLNIGIGRLGVVKFRNIPIAR